MIASPWVLPVEAATVELCGFETLAMDWAVMRPPKGSLHLRDRGANAIGGSRRGRRVWRTLRNPGAGGVPTAATRVRLSRRARECDRPAQGDSDRPGRQCPSAARRQPSRDPVRAAERIGRSARGTRAHVRGAGLLGAAAALPGSSEGNGPVPDRLAGDAAPHPRAPHAHPNPRGTHGPLAEDGPAAPRRLAPRWSVDDRGARSGGTGARPPVVQPLADLAPSARAGPPRHPDEAAPVRRRERDAGAPRHLPLLSG